MNRRLCLAAVGVLALIAAWQLLSHAPLFHWEYRLDTSHAAARAGERMTWTMPNGPVDVNRADAEALETLPDIGPVTAARIIEERETNGFFFYPEDLLNVFGIGEKTLQKLLSQIHLN